MRLEPKTVLVLYHCEVKCQRMLARNRITSERTYSSLCMTSWRRVNLVQHIELKKWGSVDHTVGGCDSGPNGGRASPTEENKNRATRINGTKYEPMMVMRSTNKKDVELDTAISVSECTAGGWSTSDDSKQERTHRIASRTDGDCCVRRYIAVAYI